MSDFANYRRDLAVLDTNASSRVPQIQHQPPTASFNTNVAPWMTSPRENNAQGHGALTSFFNDSHENIAQGEQLSPAHRPGTGRTGNTNASDSPDLTMYGDDRRPSIASVATASSTGSKGSGVSRAGFHKKLQGFFGDDFPGRDSSETSLPSYGTGKEHRSQSFPKPRERNASNATNATETGRGASPTSSRPRTPVPSSDVVPFLYQDSNVSLLVSSPDRTPHPQVAVPLPLAIKWPNSLMCHNFFNLLSLCCRLKTCRMSSHAKYPVGHLKIW